MHWAQIELSIRCILAWYVWWSFIFVWLLCLKHACAQHEIYANILSEQREQHVYKNRKMKISNPPILFLPFATRSNFHFQVFYFINPID